MSKYIPQAVYVDMSIKQLCCDALVLALRSYICILIQLTFLLNSSVPFYRVRGLSRTPATSNVELFLKLDQRL